MDKTELWQLLRKSEKMFARRKFKRMVLTVLLYAAVCFGIIYLQGQLSAENVLHIVGEFVSCIFLGAITYYFNLLVWGYIFRKSQEEEDALAYLRKRLKEKEQEDAHP